MNAQPSHGDRYGKLTVLYPCGNEKRGRRYVCGCECGNKKTKASAAQLNSGRVTACLKCSEAHR